MPYLSTLNLLCLIAFKKYKRFYSLCITKHTAAEDIAQFLKQITIRK